jgi:uncharacterized membrane protein YkvA (DUF1232 family)
MPVFDRSPRTIAPPPAAAAPVAPAGIGRMLTSFGPLVWALLRSRDVASWKKVATVALPLLYVVFPIDVLPDIIPLAGRVDDGGVSLGALLLFVRSVPREVIESTLTARLGMGTRRARALTYALFDTRKLIAFLVVGTILLAIGLTVLTVAVLVAIFN